MIDSYINLMWRAESFTCEEEFEDQVQRENNAGDEVRGEQCFEGLIHESSRKKHVDISKNK